MRSKAAMAPVLAKSRRPRVADEIELPDALGCRADAGRRVLLKVD
jgi:hypothetical protein